MVLVLQLADEWTTSAAVIHVEAELGGSNRDADDAVALMRTRRWIGVGVAVLVAETVGVFVRALSAA
jgi:hypothetical protein